MTTDNPDECTDPRCQQIASTASDVYCEITGGRLSYPTYDARTILSEANDYTQQLVDESVAEAVGPLLERLDQAENDVNEWKDWEARARGRADDLQQRLDQQTAEIERMSGWRRLWRGRYRNLWQVSEQYRAELAAAQARAERLESACRRALDHLNDPSFGLAEQTLAAAKLITALARPLPEPEQPKHQRLSSFGDPYCGACKKDWPCPDACDAEVVCDRLPDV